MHCSCMEHQIDIKFIYQSNLSFDFWNQTVKKRRTVVLFFMHMQITTNI